MTDDVTIRRATGADANAVRDLVFGTLFEFGLKPDAKGTDADLFDFPGSYDAGTFDVLVDSGGLVLGCVGLLPHGEGTVELRKMYLAKESRRRGYGKMLLDHALRRARELGARRVTLETAAVLTDAIAMYERAGFRPDPSAVYSGRCDLGYVLELPV